jgi:lipopolysaccharide transport system permease protein
MISNAPLVRRSACPRVALVNGALVANLATLGVMSTITIVLAIALNGLKWQLVAFPFLVVALVVFLWGPALMLASIAARFRDAVAIIPLILQAGMFVSPVGYPIAGTTGGLWIVLSLNPISGLIEAWRWSILGVTPQTLPLICCAGWILVLSVAGWRVFTRLEPEFADYL